MSIEHVISAMTRPGSLPITGKALVALAALAGACTGQSGTIAVELVTAPDSALLDQVTTARLTLTNPRTVVESDRGQGPPALDLEVVASGQSGALIFEGFDESGALIAYGRSSEIPIAAISGSLRLYVGAPLSMAAAPDPSGEPTSMSGRTDLAVSATPAGVVIAGGRDRSGQPVADAHLYNLYEHELAELNPIGWSGISDEGRPRAGMTAVTLGAVVYLFGGEDAAGMASAAGWSFDPLQPPRGVYIPLDTDAAAPRSGASAAVLGDSEIVIAGDPLLVLSTFTRQISPLPGAPAAFGTATTIPWQGGRAVIFAGMGNGERGALVLAGGEVSALEALDAPAAWARTGHAAPALPDGSVLVVGGEGEGGLLASAVRYDPAAMEFALLDDFLMTPRRNAAVATTDAYLVIAGGEDADGQVVGNAEIVALPSLEHITQVPLVVPRTGASAVALSNGQVLLVGGADADGEPTAVIELFTPGAP